MRDSTIFVDRCFVELGVAMLPRDYGCMRGGFAGCPAGLDALDQRIVVGLDEKCD